jgi:beta-glucosidase
VVSQARTPWNGRNFEYTGEDPYLARTCVASEVAGIQSVPGIIGCVKHFVGESAAEVQR